MDDSFDSKLVSEAGKTSKRKTRPPGYWWTAYPCYFQPVFSQGATTSSKLIKILSMKTAVQLKQVFKFP